MPSSNFDTASFRSSAALNNFFNTRPRHATMPSIIPFSQEAAQSFQPSYNMTAADVFGTHQQAQLPIQQPSNQQVSDALPQMGTYDYINGSHQNSSALKNNGVKPIFTNMDPFAMGSASAVLQSHQVPLSSMPHSQVPPTQQHSYGASVTSPILTQSYMNGVTATHSQTPYGPHVSSNNIGNALGVQNGNLPSSSQEEISTIFVVGFPDDMQEREFQNMFTFSPGFEAATLKIPNKDSTAYGPANGGNNSNIRSGSGYPLNYPGPVFPGSNDPYNLVTLNQGGVVVDGRDGTTSWPSTTDELFGRGGDTSHLTGAPTVPPRKQIIGFAKFRSRNEALVARDVLQGRRVDIDKGAVLKAEMAKKNLHTKRGVGPLGGVPLNNMVPNSGGVAADGLTGISALNGMNPSLSSGGEPLTARDRELGALGAMGLNSAVQRRDRLEFEEERENRRRREMGSMPTLGSMNFMNAVRGPRERAEEEDRERERRRQDKEARLRSNSSAFDAFNSVALQSSLPNRNGPLGPGVQSANLTPVNSTMLSPTENLSSYPFTANGSAQASYQDSFAITPVEGWSSVNKIPQAGLSLNLGGSSSQRVGVPAVLTSQKLSSSSLQSSPQEAVSESTFPPSLSGAPSDSTPSSAPFSSPLEDVQSLPMYASNQPRSRPFSPISEASVGQGLSFSGQFLTNPSSIAPSIASSGVPSSRASNSSADGDMANTMSGMNIGGADQGMVSPQLPSPSSGGSTSTSTRASGSDQNPPINTLYVGNLPTSPLNSGFSSNQLEDTLRSLFQQCPGYRKLCFRQKSNGPMCFVEFDDVSYAAKALNDLYGHQLNGLVRGGIRLSYSKNPLGVRSSTNSLNGNGNSGQSQQSPSTLPAPQGVPQTSIGRLGSQDMFGSRDPVGDFRGTRRDDLTSPVSPFPQFAASPPPRFVSPPIANGFGVPIGSGMNPFPRPNPANYVIQPASSNFSPFSLSPSPPTRQPSSGDRHEHATLSATPVETARAA